MNIQIWIELYDDPSLGKSLQPSHGQLANLISTPIAYLFCGAETTEASKKALSKAKKAARRGNDPSQESHDVANKKGELRIRLRLYTFSSLRWRIFSAVSNQSDDKGLDAPPPKDDDPDGVKMVLADDSLEKAAKFLATLKESGKHNVDVCLTNFDVAIRRSEYFRSCCIEGFVNALLEKYMQAAWALVRAHAVDTQHPELHLRVVQFGKTGESFMAHFCYH